VSVQESHTDDFDSAERFGLPQSVAYILRFEDTLPPNVNAELTRGTTCRRGCPGKPSA
jgi:hypothetical protein